jgi:phosphoserine phosphatase RsbU/P
MPETGPASRVRLALRASTLGTGSTGWMSPRRRWMARGALLLTVVCIGASMGLFLQGSLASSLRWPFLLGMGLATVGFLVYDVIMGVEILEKRAYEAEMSVAAQIQARLFPRELPQHAGLSVSAYHRPARAVGGDYYDIIPMGPGRFTLVVADVSGKGVPAAILMASLRTQIRVLSPRGLSPSTLITYMNESVYADTEPSQYATLFFGQVDLNQGTLTYVNAGHVAPLIVGTMGTRRWLATGGLPLGMFSGRPFEQGTEFFGPGDRLVLYTDGISDVGVAEDETLSAAQLESLVVQNRTASLDELTGRIIQEVKRVQRRTDQSDDITLLVVGADAA